MNEEQQYIRDLIDGKTAAPNHYIQGVVDTLREAEAQGRQMQPQLQQAQFNVEQLKQAQIAVAATVRNGTLLLLKWREKELAATAEDKEA